ncbi:MAG: YihY/virulence factor BrkB family protein [Bacteroidota bacterium]
MNLNRVRTLYVDLNRLSGDRLGILREAITTFSAMRGGQAAASLAYYAIFSLFPLLLVLIVAGSYFIDSERVYMTVIYSVERLIPASPQLIEENLQYILKQRESVGIIVLITLLWSASGVFTNLAYNINLAWADAPARNFLNRYLIGIAMVLVLSGLLAVSILLDWATHLIPFMGWLGSSPLAGFWVTLSGLISWLVVFLLFMGLYLWIPTVPISAKAALWSALLASTAWKLATTAFAWYLQSGLNRYSVVYGSLGAIIALLVLIYWISLITLFGAHLAAAIDRRMKYARAQQQVLKGV